MLAVFAVALKETLKNEWQNPMENGMEREGGEGGKRRIEEELWLFLFFLLLFVGT